MIVHQNPGLIDLRAVTTLGISVKENENPIGFFGTGFKYAIAVLLRNGAKIELRRGTESYFFTSKEEEVRGRTFGLVCLTRPDGSFESLGFTTELGKNWEMWQAFRELHSNTLDEGGESFHTFEEPQPTAGETQVIIRSALYETSYHERHTIFLNTRPVFETPFAEIHDAPGEYIYYRGVRALKLQQQSAVTYNILSEITLTEDRTIANSWMVNHFIAACWNKCRNIDLLNKGLSCEFGKTISFSSMIDDSSATWATPFIEDGSLQASAAYESEVWRVNRENFRFKETKLTQQQKEVLEKTKLFCETAGLPIDRYNIIIADRLANSLTTTVNYDRKQIMLSVRVLDLGPTQLAAALFEGYYRLSLDLMNFEQVSAFFLSELIKEKQAKLQFAL